MVAAVPHYGHFHFRRRTRPVSAQRNQLCSSAWLTFSHSYTALERSGKAEKLAVSSQRGTVLPLSEDEIKAAIEELDRSTEAISKQTGALKQQQEALARLAKTSGQCKDARADAERKQLQRWESDRKHMSAEVNTCNNRYPGE